MNFKEGNFNPAKNTFDFFNQVDRNKRLLHWAVANSDVGFIELWYHNSEGEPSVIELTQGALKNEETFCDLVTYWKLDDAVVLSFVSEEDATALGFFLGVDSHEDIFYKVDYDDELYERGKKICESLQSHPDTLRAVWKKSYKND